MARLNIAPTKSNLLNLKNQLAIAQDGYELLEQKREILVMELMNMVERVRILEASIEKAIEKSYSALKKLLIAAGGDRVDFLAKSVEYDFKFREKEVTIAGMHFPTIDVELPKRQLFYSFLNSFASSDLVMVEFFDLLKLLTEMASIRTIVWKLAGEVKKTQRRVNALDKMVIPQSKETKIYIESILEERERENIFVLKNLKAKQNQ
ncbi:MAG: V-type ATP synthase subunit D [Treponemataceae bacterium]